MVHLLIRSMWSSLRKLVFIQSTAGLALPTLRLGNRPSIKRITTEIKKRSPILLANVLSFEVIKFCILTYASGLFFLMYLLILLSHLLSQLWHLLFLLSLFLASSAAFPAFSNQLRLLDRLLASSTTGFASVPSLTVCFISAAEDFASMMISCTVSSASTLASFADSLTSFADF